MIKEKQRDKKKNGTPSGSSLENNGTPGGGSNGDNREEMKEHVEKGTEVKEEPDESIPELRDSISTNNSPLEDVKSSPTQPTEKEVGSLLQNTVACKALKSENGENTDSNFRNDSCEGVLPLGLPSETIHEGVQPLPSNVINKQPVTMEAQYMQQQSQIFVFSTALANKAAEAVIQGQYASIIAYHCAQPRTKKYLEGSGHQGSVMQPQCGTNMGMEPNANKGPHPNHPVMMQSSNSLMPDNMMSSLGDFSQEMGLGTHQPLTGVKVPDEDLTPQQRQHREEQLATLRKMQQMLFPEALPGPSEGNSGQVIDEVIMPENVDMNKPPVTQSDWHKLQLQFYEEQKIKKNRTTGPPPSYQQATRSASVPVALPSPNPSSPNNTTSNLSLPSPRTCSGINSPADKVNPRMPGPSPTMDSPNPARSTNSNPPTPVSIHLSPKHKDKLNTTNEFSPSSTVSAPNSQQSPVDSMYCRSVQSIGQSKTGSNNGGKEPNLMPVPSPQQIQYLNAFEGQELTIQKQPNTSLKEPGRKSPVLAPTSLEGVLPSGANEIPAKVGNSPAPSTPDRGSFTADVPSSEAPAEKPIQQPQRKIDSSFCNSPQTNERCHINMPNNFMQKGGPGFMENPPAKCANLNEKDISNGNYQCIGPDNVPLNPNGMNRMNVSSANKSSHFDPISSLAQMSQQLTNNVPNSPVNQPAMMPNMHQNMVQFNSPNSNNPHLMPMNDLHHIPNTPPDHRIQNQMQHFTTNNRVQCNNNITPNISVSPKLMQGFGVPQRPMPRAMNYNGASVQVKPNAPNTIQYLPSRPQSNNGPRGPPSLEFLQRFSNPLSNLDAKVPTHNLQYFPNNYPQNNMNEMGICPPHGNIRGPLRGANPTMMRLQGPQMPPMGFNNTEMFSNTNCQMFVPPTKTSALGMAPDASQPLPPSMGQSNNFKNSTFIGPTTADPNYAQQFHNFQQQLYATNTRGQLNSQNMGNNQHYFMPK